jgi:hypothetical protein
MKVALCFSFAKMKMAKTNPAVRIPSMQTPYTRLDPPTSVVLTLRLVGNKPSTTAEAAIPPASWAKKKKRAHGIGTAPTRTIPSVTAGLNNPPEMRKKIQTLTIRGKPNIIEI